MNLSINRGMIRRALLCALCLLALLPAAGFAGDSAQMNVIGFSPDGKVFAFEEFGIQDGSGFAYSNIYFIHTQDDKFIPGTPIKVLSEKEHSIAAARREAHMKAEALIAQFRLEDDPGVIAAYNPVSEVDSKPHLLRFYQFPANPPRSQTFTIEIKEKVFPAPKACLNMVGAFSGFSLTLTEAASQPASQLIYEDKQVPASRNCPNGYRLAAIVTSETAKAAPIMAMIQVSTFGFEGNDERWIAVPIRLAGTP